MSVNAPAFYSTSFATNIRLLLQQMGSRLRGSVMEGSYVGKAAQVVDQVGAIEALPAGARFSPLGRVDAAYDSRWVYPADYEIAQLYDNFDQLKMLVDPKSVANQNAVAAFGRKIDSIIIRAMRGTSKTGVDGGTSTDLPNGQKVTISQGGANSGLTVFKLRKALQILRENNLDPMEQCFLSCKALQLDNLLAEAQVISLDFNERPVLQDGKVVRFLNFNIIHTQLNETSTTTDYAMVWAKSGVHLGIWNDITTDVSQRKDITSLPWQAYAKMSIGATRIEEKKVVEIACYNA